MKRKTVFFLLLLPALCMLLGGCRFRLTAVDRLLRPPKLTGENAGLQRAFEKAVDTKNVLMKSPTTGLYRSAYVLFDFDGDGEDEAVAFYGDPSDNTVVYMHVFDKNGAGEWVSAADVKGSGSEVYKLDFCDMNGDGIFEIVVCWSLYESRGNKLLTVYEPENREGKFTLRAIATENFTQTLICDLDGNGRDEILSVLADTASEVSRSRGRLFRMNDDFSITLASEAELTPAVSVSALKLEEDPQGGRVFVDFVINDAEIVTDVLCWEAREERLVSLLKEENLQQPPRTARSSKLASGDMDGDGKLEIPVLRELPGAVTLTGEKEEPLYLTAWLDVSEKGLVKKMDCLMLYASSCFFAFDEEWRGSITAVSDVGERSCVFYAYDRANAKRGRELFRIVTLPAGDRRQKPPEGFAVLGSGRSLQYICNITQAGGRLGITPEYIQSHFSIIE